MKKNSVLKDIAIRAEVSITTVSIILANKGSEMGVSKTMIRKVKEIAIELRYIPSVIARGLAQSTTQSIGLIVEDLSNPFFSRFTRRIEEEAKNKGYKVFCCSCNNNLYSAVDQIKTLLEANVAGFIISPPERMQKNIRHLLKISKPVVLIDRYLPDLNCSYVMMDNYDAAYKATTYLRRQGYKNIALVTLNSDAIQMTLREKGYEEALQGTGMYRESLILRVEYNSSKEQKTFDIVQFIKNISAVDSILFLCNYLCISGLEALKKMELKIPDDIAVMSFDDYSGFLLHTPSISVVEQPIKAMAVDAVTILTHKIMGSAAIKTDQVFQKASMSIRGST